MLNKQKIKILLVEDDNFLREICAKKLLKQEFVVIEAINGEEALRKIKKTLPDIVLLDIILPVIDGFEVLKKIREYEETKQIPVIMLSNLGQKEDVQKAFDLGANNYLIKAHFTTEDIVNKIKKELKIVNT